MVLEQHREHDEDEPNHRAVQQHVDDVKTGGKSLKDFIADDKTQSHQGAVVIGPAFQSLEGPNGSGQNLSDILETVHIGILLRLKMIVVYKPVQQRIAIKRQRQE